MSYSLGLFGTLSVRALLQTGLYNIVVAFRRPYLYYYSTLVIVALAQPSASPLHPLNKPNPQLRLATSVPPTAPARLTALLSFPPDAPYFITVLAPFTTVYREIITN